jgi:putative membrane protein
MYRSNLVTAFCAFVFVAGVSVAQAKSPDRGKQQDKQFLRTVAIADMTEAHLGEMAQSMAAKAPVKDFGKTVAMGETQEYGQLTVLANKCGEAIPKGINTRKVPAVRVLMQAKGNSFDRSFLRDEIADERRIIAVFQREAAHGENPDIKAWAEKAVAGRQQELQKAQSLAR